MKSKFIHTLYIPTCTPVTVLPLSPRVTCSPQTITVYLRDKGLPDLEREDTAHQDSPAECVTFSSCPPEHLISDLQTNVPQTYVPHGSPELW